MQQSHWLRASDERAGISVSSIKGFHGGYSLYPTNPLERSDKTIPTPIANNCNTKCRIKILLTPKDVQDLSTSIESLNVTICLYLVM